MVLPLNVFSQKRLLMSQYVHNRYTINSAFAGSRETLSLMGSYRKQWTSVPNSPNAQFFSAHAPLKADNMALGLTMFNEEFAITQNTGVSFAYTYRISDWGNKLAFSINGGVISTKSMWSEVTISNPNDPAFGENETGADPQIGFGVAWYGQKFFAGFSIADFLYNNPIDSESSFFEPLKTDYIFTGGYLFSANSYLKIQPSFLYRLNPDEYSIIDFSVSAIIYDLLWAGLTYRNNKETIAMIGWQITPQLRFAYSYDYPSGDLGTFNNGNHEVTLQFDFGYRFMTTSPKFF